MGLGKAINKALKQISKAFTNPFTHSVRHRIEDEYHKAMAECAQLQKSALVKLNAQLQEERARIEARRNTLEHSLKNNTELFKLEKAKLNAYLQEKEQALNQAFDEIQHNFELLRAALLSCMRGEMAIVESLLKRSNDLRIHFMSFNPLSIAAENNQGTIISLLCRYGADIFRRNGKNLTALEVAEQRGHVEATDVLKTIIKETRAFWGAVDGGDNELMKALIDQGVAVNSTFPEGHNILGKALLDKKSFELIRLLVMAKVDFNPVVSAIPTTVGSANTESKTRKEVETTTIVTPQENALKLLSMHPDKRVKTFILEYFGMEHEIPVASQLEDFSPLAYHYHRFDSYPYSTFMNVRGENQFFSHTSCFFPFLYRYDVAKQMVCQHNLKDPRGALDQYRIIALQKIQIRGEKEKLLVIAFKGEEIIVSHYDPDIDRWNQCRRGPMLKIATHSPIASAPCLFQPLYSADGQDKLFLLYHSPRGVELCSYTLAKDEWEIHPLPAAVNELHRRMQMTVIQKMNGQQYLFLLQDNVQLWRYDVSQHLWALQPPLPIVNLYPQKYNSTKMKKVEINGETHLFFTVYQLRCVLELWSFNLETGVWTLHPGGPAWRKQYDTDDYNLSGGLHASDCDVVHMEVVPGYHKSDILVLFNRIAQSPVPWEEGVAYHPLSKTWLPLSAMDIHLERSGINMSLGRRDAPRTQVHVEWIGEQYRVIVFCDPDKTQDLRKIYGTKCVTYPLNVRALEDRLLSAPPVAVSFDVDNARARAFLHRIMTATQALLKAAREGDWPLVQLSLEQGADVHATESEGYNALQLALTHSLDIGTLRRLLQAGIALNYRGNIQHRTALDLARGADLVDVYNYMAAQLDKRAFQLIPDISAQFNSSYQRHLDRAHRFLDKRPTDIQKCQAIMMYCHLLSRTNPYILYTWPAMLMLGELLNLPEEALKIKPEVLRAAQSFFLKTFAAHRALIEVGVEHYSLLNTHPDLLENDWTHVLHALRLRNEADQPEKTEGAVFKELYERHQTLWSQGTLSALMGFAKVLTLDTHWVKEACEWLVEQQRSPFLLRECFKKRFKKHLHSVVHIAREAIDEGLIVLPTSFNPKTVLKTLAAQEQALIVQLKKKELDFVQEKAGLLDWLKKREEDYLQCIHEIAQLVQATHQMDAEALAQFQKAVNEIQAYFDKTRQELTCNKADSLNRVRKKTFKSLVVMAASCCTASAVAPLLASALGGSALLALTQAQIAALQMVLRGAIMGGINGGFARKNVLKSSLKGGVSSNISYVGETVVRYLREGWNARAVSTVLEAALRTAIERSNLRDNLLVKVLALDGPSSKEPSFLQALHANLFRALVSSSIHATVAKQHLGSNLLSAGVTSVITTSASQLGQNLSEMARTPRIKTERRTARISDFEADSPSDRSSTSHELGSQSDDKRSAERKARREVSKPTSGQTYKKSVQTLIARTMSLELKSQNRTVSSGQLKKQTLALTQSMNGSPEAIRDTLISLGKTHAASSLTSQSEETFLQRGIRYLCDLGMEAIRGRPAYADTLIASKGLGSGAQAFITQSLPTLKLPRADEVLSSKLRTLHLKQGISSDNLSLVRPYTPLRSAQLKPSVGAPAFTLHSVPESRSFGSNRLSNKDTQTSNGPRKLQGLKPDPDLYVERTGSQSLISLRLNDSPKKLWELPGSLYILPSQERFSLLGNPVWSEGSSSWRRTSWEPPQGLTLGKKEFLEPQYIRERYAPLSEGNRWWTHAPAYGTSYSSQETPSSDITVLDWQNVGVGFLGASAAVWGYRGLSLIPTVAPLMRQVPLVLGAVGLYNFLGNVSEYEWTHFYLTEDYDLIMSNPSIPQGKKDEIEWAARARHEQAEADHPGFKPWFKANAHLVGATIAIPIWDPRVRTLATEGAKKTAYTANHIIYDRSIPILRKTDNILYDLRGGSGWRHVRNSEPGRKLPVPVNVKQIASTRVWENTYNRVMKKFFNIESEAREFSPATRQFLRIKDINKVKDQLDPETLAARLKELDGHAIYNQRGEITCHFKKIEDPIKKLEGLCVRIGKRINWLEGKSGVKPEEIKYLKTFKEELQQATSLMRKLADIPSGAPPCLPSPRP
jgi:ankyrin repeat protein